MDQYGISGVWKNADNVITAYAVHTINDDALSLAVKTTKEATIALLERDNIFATTLIWNYTKAMWYVGETIRVVGSRKNKYLSSNPDNSLTDHLGHLIHFN